MQRAITILKYLLVVMLLASSRGEAHDLISSRKASVQAQREDAPATNAPHLGPELAARTGGTIALELARAGSSKLIPGLTALMLRFMAPGAAGFAATAVATAGVYMAYKAGWDLVSSYFAPPGKSSLRFDPVQIVAVGLGATAGSLLLGRILHPLVGAWLGEWFGWCLAEGLVNKWRQRGHLDLVGAVKDIDGSRVALTALATEATGHGILRGFGMTAGVATPGLGWRLAAAGLATKILGTALVKLTTLKTYDKVTTIGATDPAKLAAERSVTKTAIPVLAPHSEGTRSREAYQLFKALNQTAAPTGDLTRAYEAYRSRQNALARTRAGE